jgi:cobalt/nickel transport system permease protein
MTIVVSTLSVFAWSQLFFFMAMLAVLSLVACIPIGHFCRRSLFLLVPIWLLTVPFAWVHADGCSWYLFLMLKSSLAIGFMVLLMMTTPFSGILEALSTLRVPSLLIALLAVTFRYIHLLWEESERLQRAYRLRAFSGNWPLRRRALSYITGTLFVRSLQRSERIYDAMRARGFTGVFPKEEHPMPSLREVVFLALLFASVISVRVFV